MRLFLLRPLAELDERAPRPRRRSWQARSEPRASARNDRAGSTATAAIPRVESAAPGDVRRRARRPDRCRSCGELVGTAPTVDIPRSELEAGIGIVDLLARTVCDSKGAARRMLQQGGAYLNSAKQTDVERKIGLADLLTETMLVIRGGKKDYRLVRAV